MKIINHSTQKIITKKAKQCGSWWSKARGLMFSKKKTLLFVFSKEKKASLHMVGVFFPIDIILLNTQKQVIEIKENLKPLQFFESKTKARYVIESPKGTIQKSGVKPGHQCKW